MSRPIYFTGRQPIDRAHVRLKVSPERSGALRLAVGLDLESYGFPPKALVILEAYHGAYLSRKGLGSVEQPKREVELSEAGDPAGLLFRLKVVAPTAEKVLLGAIDRVRLDESAGRSMLPVISKPLEVMGEELWRVEWVVGEEGGRAPELWVNAGSDFDRRLQAREPVSVALVMPAALREVLTELVGHPAADDDEVGPSRAWRLFGEGLHEPLPEWDEEAPEDSRERRRTWIAGVVRAFCRAHGMKRRYDEAVAAPVEED